MTYEITPTKTGTSDRIVYMQDELFECCREIKQFIHLEKMRHAYRSEIFIPDINTGGHIISYDAYCKYFRENTERLLGRRLTPHSLRHTHTAMLAEAGVPLQARPCKQSDHKRRLHACDRQHAGKVSESNPECADYRLKPCSRNVAKTVFSVLSRLLKQRKHAVSHGSGGLLPARLKTA